MMPATMGVRTAAPDDDDLSLLACRRLTFEWVLRRAVAAEGNVGWRGGSGVAALMTGVSRDSVPVITGVCLEDGSVETGDLVVEAGGRRTAIMRHLDAIKQRAGVGQEPNEEVHECGIIYYTRFYRFKEGAAPPPTAMGVGADLGYLKYGVFRGDNRTFSITLASDGDDATMRRIAHAPLFDATAAAIPAMARWIEAERAEAITDVQVMAKLRNRRRHFVVDGRPVALGLAVVGDAAICTNPLYGRGCSLGSVHGFLLADTLAAHERDFDALAHAFHAATVAEIEPFYRSAVAQDDDAKHNAALVRGDIVDAPDSPAAQVRSIVREGLLPATRTDPVVFRAFMRSFNLLDKPDAIMSNPEVIERVMKSWAARHDRPAEPLLGPTRNEMLNVLDAAAARPEGARRARQVVPVR